ncbi:hypothetical protein HMI49_22885 [Corallococcus exercitus]|uniref:DUF2493 domain-containing protein n=1 Tax=Corallococcus exercitus TaxID=2316736 RepID=A0A7Y4NUI2_9BACT|nr:hypothetical protein [Corallococcus exercitus]NOK36052.1 hypothetical protein [Corallococcus exercitus]
MIIALAGRRIDAANAPAPRFPMASVTAVRHRLRELFVTQGARALVCSAACGSDLLALEVAGELGVRRRIVLPFEPERFRRTSVLDRPGDWGGAFDRVLREVKPEDVVVMPGNAGGVETYTLANEVILNEARALAEEGEQILAVTVWEGAPRGSNDVTAAFSQSARERGLQQVTVLTRV